MDENDKSIRLFENTSMPKLFLKVSVPGSIGMIATNIFWIVEGLLVSRALGSTTFAAFNLALPLVYINFALSDFIGVGSSVRISIKLGQNDRKAANEIFTMAVFLIAFTSFLMLLLLYFGGPFFFRLMNADETLIPDAVAYLRGYALFAPLTALFFAVDNYLKISGKVKYSMAINIIMSLLAFTLDFLFLFVFGMGVGSVAVGSSISLSICTIIGLFPFIRKKTVLTFTHLHLKLDHIRDIFSSGLPVFLATTASRITSIFINSILLLISTADSVSIYGVLMQIDGFIMPFLYGLCDSLQPAVGYNWGRGDLKRVKKIETVCYSVALIISSFSFVILLAFPVQIMNIFFSSMDESFISAARTAIVIFSFTYITRWINFSTQSFASAIGMPLYATLISIAQAIVFPVICFLLIFPFGVNGIYANMASSGLLTLLLSLILLSKLLRLFRKS